MPKFLESKLKAQAKSEGLKGRRADAYVYGTMNNMGAMHGNEETEKGAKMEEKHRRDTEMAKYQGKSSDYNSKRPSRKIQNRYSR